MTKRRNLAIDAIKGLAIISVALYHFGGGYLPFGYLGVDIFFVVGGYLLIRSLKHKIEQDSFNYFSFLVGKIVRLWPLVIIATSVAMMVGYFSMLPDDYENLAESAVASSLFANNVLQCITTKNYWNIVNLYKPLMHMWYIGVLMQAYVILPLVYFAISKINKKKCIAIATIGLTTISLVMYLLPLCSPAWKFYFLPFRAFEITCGGLIVLWNPQFKGKKWVRWFSVLTLLLLLCSRQMVLSGSAMLIFTAVCTILFLWSSAEEDYSGAEAKMIVFGAEVGKRSYSFYICHQVIVAFLCYSVFSSQSIWAFLTFVMMTTVFSLLSFHFVEVPLGKAMETKRWKTIIVITTSVFAIGVCGISFQIYRHAGVVRDVPELGIELSNAHRNMHAEYCDRPYSWDQDFSSNDKIRVLVIGNSYGRDWANILSEYDTNKMLEISYIYYTNENLISRKERIEKAEIVFFATGPEIDKTVPQWLVDKVPHNKLWVISNKQYGTSNGIIYARRNSESYYSQTVSVQQWLIDMNNEQRSIYGTHFIDMLEPVMKENNQVAVFTDQNMFISQDCSHLTKAGAQYYARILDLESIFIEKE